jgi:hypothetical protein
MAEGLTGVENLSSAQVQVEECTEGVSHGARWDQAKWWRISVHSLLDDPQFCAAGIDKVVLMLEAGRVPALEEEVSQAVAA